MKHDVILSSAAAQAHAIVAAWDAIEIPRGRRVLLGLRNP